MEKFVDTRGQPFPKHRRLGTNPKWHLKKSTKTHSSSKNGYGYFPFWDTKTGKVIIQIENPSASDKPIFEDGNWNVNADTIGLTDQQKAVYWEQTKQSISDAYNLLPNSGGQGNQKKCKSYHNGSNLESIQTKHN